MIGESDYLGEDDQLRLKHFLELEHLEESDTEVDEESDEYYLRLGDEGLFEIGSSGGIHILPRLHQMTLRMIMGIRNGKTIVWASRCILMIMTRLAFFFCSK